MKTNAPIKTKDYFLTKEPFTLIKIKELDIYKTEKNKERGDW